MATYYEIKIKNIVIMKIFLTSKKDIASYNIYKYISQKLKISSECIRLSKDSYLIVTDKKLTEDVEIPEKFRDVEFVAILYRHASKSKEKCFTVHATGDISKNKLSRCNPIYMKRFLMDIFRVATEYHVNYRISIEATHHGPITELPLFFVEIGSDESAWNDKNAVKVIAETSLNIVKKQHSNKYKNAIAIGSNHYSEKFSRIQLNTEFAIGHFISKYHLNNLTEDLVINALEKSSAKTILADKKLKGKYKDILRDICKRHDIELYFV